MSCRASARMKYFATEEKESPLSCWCLMIMAALEIMAGREVSAGSDRVSINYFLHFSACNHNHVWCDWREGGGREGMRETHF